VADQLQPVPLITPGFKGLNTAQASVPDLDPGWAIVCQNFVFDVSGRLASRNGWTQTTVAPIAGTPAIASQGELVLASGSVFVVSAANNKLYSGTTTLTDVTGSLTITGNNWQWFTFNGSIYGVQAGHPLITWNGTGNFALAALASPKSFTGQIAGTTLTVTAITSGVLGQLDVIAGAGVTVGTQIVAQLTGVAGSNGTYQVNASQTVGPVTMTVAAGSLPTGGTCGTAAFGRLWVLGSDNQTIQYCTLLDATTWNGAGAGSINMGTVWTRGIDQVIGIFAAGNKLVVFGTKQIVIFFDNTNPPIGLNPQNISVFDTIEGTGLAARDTVQSTGEGDLTFLSPTGIQSLQRLISSGKQNPVAALDNQTHDYFNGFFVNENIAAVRSAYSPLNRFYVILLPVAGRAFCYDTRQRLQDGSMRVTEWPTVTWTSLLNQKSGTVLFGEKGVVGTYGGYLDNGNTFTVIYNSPNLALSSQGQNNFENHQKILKRMKAVLYYGGTSVVTFFWGVDFLGLNSFSAFSLLGSVAEYGTAEYGTNGKTNVTKPAPPSGVTYAEYGGAAGLVILGFPLSLSGRWIQFGFSAPINGSQVAIQQLDAFVKIGNMV
jgi:hypothetical protein